mgnify:CR=1 FL=1
MGGSDVPIYDYHTGEQTGYLDRGANGLTVEDQRRFYTNLYTYLKYDFTTPNLYHNFNIMAGYSQESEKYETVRAFRKEYAFDLPVIDAGSNANWSNEGKLEEWAIQSVFARLNYNLKNVICLKQICVMTVRPVFLQKIVGVSSHHSLPVGVLPKKIL